METKETQENLNQNKKQDNITKETNKNAAFQFRIEDRSSQYGNC